MTEYCNRAILLEKGHVVAEGDPAEVVRVHQEHSARRKAENGRRLGSVAAAAVTARRSASVMSRSTSAR